MPRSLKYKDNRAKAYVADFADERHNTDPVTITGTKTVTRSDGKYVYRQLDIQTLINTVEELKRSHKVFKQEINGLKGQLESIAKDGVDGYTSRINDIKTRHPKPQS